MLTGEIFTMTCKISRYMNRTLPFNETDHLRYSVLRWYGDQQWPRRLEHYMAAC